MKWQQLPAVIARGQRLASGTSTRDPIFNEEIVINGRTGKGTIFLQAGEFKKQGLDLDAYFGEGGYYHGTLNLLIEPRQWKLGREGFDYMMRDVRWTELLDEQGKKPFVENFLLSPCQIEFKGKDYKAMIYIPDPATKPDQHAPLAPYIDVIAPFIPDITYGDSLMLRCNPEAIKISG
jgi:hypothetical protein